MYHFLNWLTIDSLKRRDNFQVAYYNFKKIILVQIKPLFNEEDKAL